MPNAQELIRALMASPEEQQAVAQASQAAATHLRRPDLRGIQYGSQPDVQAARQQGLEGVAGMAAMAHPLGQAGALIDALSSPAGAKTLTPNTTAMTSAGGELPPRLLELQQKIDEETHKMSSQPQIFKSVTTGRGKDRSVAREPDTAAMEYRDREAKENIAKWREEAQAIIHSRQTFDEGAPDWLKTGVRYGGPVASLGTSVPLGFFKPGVGSAAMSALYGAAEGMGAHMLPEAWDLTLPKNSPGYQQAHENLSSGDWWKEAMGVPAFWSAMTGVVGSGLGHKGRVMYDAARGKGKAPPSMPTAPTSAPRAPMPQAPMAQGGLMEPMMNPATNNPVPPGNWKWKGRGGSLKLKNLNAP